MIANHQNSAGEYKKLAFDPVIHWLLENGHQEDAYQICVLTGKILFHHKQYDLAGQYLYNAVVAGGQSLSLLEVAYKADCKAYGWKNARKMMAYKQLKIQRKLI